MVDLQSQYHRFADQLNAAVQNCMADARFIKGPEVELLERELARKFNVKHCISCANGTDALQLAFMALDFPEGSEIITPSFSYAALVEVLHLLKLIPVYVDVHPDTFLMDETQIESKITDRTKAIAPVHLFGQIANMDQIRIIANNHHLKIIEDGAQSINAFYKSDSLEGYSSCLSDIGTTSFFPSKNLGCYGDGGAVFTDSDNLAFKIRMLSNHGQSKKYYHDTIGINSRLDTIQASILLVKLKYLDEFTQKRQEVANRYNSEFSEIQSITTPSNSTTSTHVYHQYTIRLSNRNERDALKVYLEENGIPSMIYYPLPLHQQKAYFQSVELPNTSYLCDTVLSLPICPELTTDNQQYIIQTIKKYYNLNK